MTCEEAVNLVPSLLDGELSESARLSVEHHLAGCDGCSAIYHALSQQDRQLQREFAPLRDRSAAVAESAIARLRSDRTSRLRFGWIKPLLAAAAGFALALLIFQPWKAGPAGTGGTTITHPVPITGVARLSLATGLIEVRPPGSADWRPMATGAMVEPGSRVRTGPRIRGELVMLDGSEIRLNGGSEVILKTARTFDLIAGQMWSTVARSENPFMVAVADATVTALGTQFDILVAPRSTLVTVVEGSTRVAGGGGEMTVKAGERVRVVDGAPRDKQEAYDLLVAVGWVNELLAMKGRDHPELVKRIDDLFAQIGRTKLENLYEQEIRALGDHCVIPLTRYLQSTRTDREPDSHKRVMAARILGDVTQPWAIPEMISLLQDPDGQVRYYAAYALRRLTGGDQGRSPAQWRDEPLDRSKPAYDQWRQWWQRNQERYPAAPIQTITTPLPPADRK